MTSINKTDYSYRISLPKNEHVNIVTVYNSLFFSIFPLKGLRVYKNNKLIQNNDSTENIQEKMIVEDDENKLVDVFGKEKIPNSYTVLPLAKDELSRSEDKEKEIGSDGEDEGIYDSMSSYLTKYLPTIFSKENTDKSDNVIYITVPIDDNKPVILLQDLLNNYEGNELYNINNNEIDYTFLEKIVKDFYIQLDFLLNNGFVFKDILLENIIYVQDRYVIFDTQNIEIVTESKEQQIKTMNIAFLKLVASILSMSFSESEDFIGKLKNIENTQLYYFLKRIEREGTMEWI